MNGALRELSCGCRPVAVSAVLVTAIPGYVLVQSIADPSRHSTAGRSADTGSASLEYVLVARDKGHGHTGAACRVPSIRPVRFPDVFGAHIRSLCAGFNDSAGRFSVGA